MVTIGDNGIANSLKKEMEEAGRVSNLIYFAAPHNLEFLSTIFRKLISGVEIYFSIMFFVKVSKVTPLACQLSSSLQARSQSVIF